MGGQMDSAQRNIANQCKVATSTIEPARGLSGQVCLTPGRHIAHTKVRHHHDTLGVDPFVCFSFFPRNEPPSNMTSFSTYFHCCFIVATLIVKMRKPVTINSATVTQPTTFRLHFMSSYKCGYTGSINLDLCHWILIVLLSSWFRLSFFFEISIICPVFYLFLKKPDRLVKRKIKRERTSRETQITRAQNCVHTKPLLRLFSAGFCQCAIL